MATMHEYDVNGMHCGACVRRIQAALRALPGVNDVEVSLREGTVRVETAPAVTDAQLRAVITSEGYTVSGSAA